MKKAILVTAISAAAFGFQGCGSDANSDANTSDTSAMATDTAANMDMPSADTDTALADTTFTNKAAISGMAEVALGKLALEKTKNAQLKDFASMMVKDHGKANEELKAIAQSKNIMLPTKLDQEHMSKMEMLKAKSGADFDKAYAEAMVEGHKKTLALMQQGGKSLNDEALKGFANKTAPVVEHHLDLITNINASIK